LTNPFDELIEMVLDADADVVVVELGELGVVGPVARLARH